jgi:carbonic anhydrase
LIGGVAAVILAAATVKAQVEFGYGKENGPSDWCSMDTTNVLCCEGKAQSPINIETAAAQYDSTLPPLGFTLAETASLTVVNNGHSIQANVPEGAATLQIGSTTYGLQQFHFHTSSEHTLNGFHAPMEMHLVHKDANGSTAVAGVFIVPGGENAELAKIWSNLPDQENEQVAVTGFNLQKLLPAATASFRYQGSLTTPPCSEGLAWSVLATPITMSPQQIGQFKSLFSGTEFPDGNARPVQPLQGRVVTTDVKPLGS